MDQTCVDSAIEQLSRLLTQPCLTSPVKHQTSPVKHQTSPVKHQIHALQLELRFLKLFFSCLAKFEGTDKDLTHMGSVRTTAEVPLIAAEKGLYQAGYFAIIGVDIKEWELVASNLQEKVGLIKPEIRRTCTDLLDCSLEFKSSSSDEILEFMDFILMNLEDLVRLKTDILFPVKMQIKSLKAKVRFSRNCVDFAAKFRNLGNLEAFFGHIQTWAYSAVCMSLLFWIDCLDAKMAPEMSTMLHRMLRRIMPRTPEVIEMYLGLMKSSDSSHSDTLLMGEIVVSFVDFLLEDLMVVMKDPVDALHEGLIFCVAFLMDPPKKPGNVDILTQIFAVIAGLTYFICSLKADEMKDDVSTDANIILSEFFEKINKVQLEVRNLHVQMPNSSISGFPRTNAMGFIDLLLGDLQMIKSKGNFIPFARKKLGRIHEELMSCSTILREMQNEHDNNEGLWTRITEVAYQAEQVICLISDSPVWYNLLCLSDVLEEIKLIKIELIRRIKDKQIYNMRKLGAKMNSRRTEPSEANTLKADEVVGLKDEADEIMAQLKAGPEKLQIVSIVGMAGVGKTTLAKKVYFDLSIQMHFYRHAWCFVSQVYKRRDLLLDILRSVTASDDFNPNKEEEDLAEQLRKRLKGQRYLIVMDNIWDIKAWNAVKDSLPDDENGSRILFTSQNRNLALQAKLNHNTHTLSSLTDEKSWEFLQEKLFGQGGCCPPDLLDTGKQIAKSCKGLPLAIVVIAGLLVREKWNLDWWKKIEESLGSHTGKEGYMSILELSYKYLPDSLKPCFLYLGAFGEGEVISARKLTLLWIVEGFVERTQLINSEITAKECLKELIDRSLVIVTKRSSTGGIKACRVHDLLRNLCLEKATHENFLHVVRASNVSPSSLDRVEYDQYRLCVYTEFENFTEPNPTGPCVHSFLLFANSRWNQSYSNSAITHFFCSFKLLKVLDMECIYLNCSFPEKITSIMHLRYLAIRGNITSIPSSISNLWYLETLVVKGSGSFVRLPCTIWKMKSLKHVDVSKRAVISFGDYGSEDFSEMDNLETFSCLSVYHGEDIDKLLGRLTRLRKLRCIFLESKECSWKGIIQFPGLTSMNDLESLKVSTYGSDRQVFHCWMRIQFQGFNFPSTLKKLSLSKFGLPWNAISTIGQLKKLEVLKLREQAFTGKRWEIEDEQFPALKFLELSNLDIEQWNVSTDTFTCLQRLVIGDCYGLEKIPSGFAEIPTLKMIELRRCSKSVESSAMEVLDEQRNYNNDELEVLIQH